ncbi:transcription termination factor Rho [Asanoa sp. NPDC049518]
MIEASPDRSRPLPTSNSSGTTTFHEETRVRATPNAPQETPAGLDPVDGIVDQRGEQYFLRTQGYAPGPQDAYLPPPLVRRLGLRPGDRIVGTLRAGDGQAPKKSGGRQGQGKAQSKPQGNRPRPVETVETVNGRDPELARRRPEFYDLTPVHPHERLRLETDPRLLTTRVIDLVMPIGKGQRALIVSPPKAGKTIVLKAVAQSVLRNNPECHVMVLLIDERPEEVTDLKRSVKGEIIASPFDRPAQDHTAVAELAVERAKRLVELGRDVVIVMDSLTRLGRAYNNTAGGNSRTLSGGVGASALAPPKRLLGAARAIDGGGSLTIIASALVDTGSRGDTLIYEEFKGTGNAELTLDRASADGRIFPAVDLNASGTRNEHLLMQPDELAAVHLLRRALAGRETVQALPQLLDQLARTGSNAEFLLRTAGHARVG